MIAFGGFALIFAENSFPITRSEVIERAQKWDGVKYFKNGTREGYTTVCSGYVSYCWKTTDTNGNPKSYSVREFYTSKIIEKIDKEELKPGDALINPNVPHIVLFESWAKEDHTKYWGYELCSGKGCNDQTNHWSIDYPYWQKSEGHENYSPVRYRYIEVESEEDTNPWWQKIKDIPDDILEWFAEKKEEVKEKIEREAERKIEEAARELEKELTKGIKDCCMVESAASGTPLVSKLDILRDFRDNVLLENDFGRKFVETYYQYSPLIAKFISNKPFLKRTIRETIIRPAVLAVGLTQGICGKD